MDLPENCPTITRALQGFDVAYPQPFKAGMKCDAGMAAGLNQLFLENLRNNCAGPVKKAAEELEKKGETLSVEVVQNILNDYALSYTFGQVGGGRSVDPVEAEALLMAKEDVKRAIKSKGGKISDYDTSEITKAAAAAVERHPVYRKEAERVVANRQKASQDLPIDIDELKPKSNEGEGAEAAA